MDALTYDLIQMLKANEDGSFTTRANRKHMLKMFARLLRRRFKLPSADSLKPKHVEFLLEAWKAEGITGRTIENRLTALRWWARKVGKASVVKRRNEDYGVWGDRSPKSRAQVLDREKIANVYSEYVRASLELQAAFGLRCEEAIKFSPSYADKGTHIELKPSWCKGGRGREVPIVHPRQREILDRVRALNDGGAMIEPGRNYIQQRWAYEHQTLKAGLRNNHGLRHGYAQWRYGVLTGMKCPAKGGPKHDDMAPEERRRDLDARARISNELGHDRLDIVRVYLGG